MWLRLDSGKKNKDPVVFKRTWTALNNICQLAQANLLNIFSDNFIIETKMHIL